MGTLRDEMSRVLNEWDKQDQQPTQEKTMEKRVTATQKLINIIAANPGATSKEIYKLVATHHPEITMGNVSSMLTQLTNKYLLSRKESGQVSQGKTIYAYTAVPEDEAKAKCEEAERKLKAAQARMEKARQIKAAKQAAREQLDKMLEEAKVENQPRTGLSDLLPQGTVFPAPAPVPAIATTSVYNTKSVWTAKEALDGLSVLQARELYGELKQIFGG
jgi:hypothetical protein